MLTPQGHCGSFGTCAFVKCVVFHAPQDSNESTTDNDEKLEHGHGHEKIQSLDLSLSLSFTLPVSVLCLLCSLVV